MANCKCGGALALRTNKDKSPMYIKCKNEKCGAVASANAFGNQFTLDELKDFMAGKAIYKECKNVAGKKYSSWIKMDFDKELKLTLDFDMPAPALFNCQCGGDVSDKGKLYICGSCGDKAMKEIRGCSIGMATIKKVFNGEKIMVDGFVSKKTSNTYSAFLVMKEGWAGVEFETEITDDVIKEAKENDADNKDFLLGASDDSETDEGEEVSGQEDENAEEEADDLFGDNDFDPDAAITES